jgi:hypothetical protein
MNYRVKRLVYPMALALTSLLFTASVFAQRSGQSE